MDIPKPSKTIVDILKELGPDWVAPTGYYTLEETTITAGKINTTPSPHAVVLKAFWNVKTNEMKFYAAKFLDVPDGDRQVFWAS